MLTRLTGAAVDDPTCDGAGKVRDFWVRDGYVCDAPTNLDSADTTTYDVSGKVLMAGAIDIHSHIAGGNVNNARVTYAVAPAYDRRIERDIDDYFDRYHLVKMANYKLSPDQMADGLGADLVVHEGAQS